MFLLGEVSGYLWNSCVYLDKETNICQEEQAIVKKLEKNGAIVPKLYTDNWYTSERLFAHLQQTETVAYGTAMCSHLQVPPLLKTKPLE